MRLWLTGVLLAILALLFGLNFRISGARERGVFATNPPSPYFHYPPEGSALSKVLVVHGLDSNKEIMSLLCYALSDTGFDVYAMDLPGHGDSHVPFNAISAQRTVAAALDILGPETLAIGHSMGAALLLDVANDRAIPAMALLSPAPTAIDQIQANRVLILTAQFDPPPIPIFVQGIEDSGAIHHFQRQTIAWAGHSGYVLRPGAIRTVVTWLGGNPQTIQTGSRLTILLLELVILLTIPLIWLGTMPPTRGVVVRLRPLLISYVAAAGVALLVCALAVVLQFLRLFAADYLISFVFLTGMTLLPAALRKTPLSTSGISAGGISALYVIASVVILGSNLAHFIPSDGRWWRFLVMAVVLAPLALADEVFLRPIRPLWRAASAMALTRIIIAAFAVTGVLTFNRSDAFLVLLIHIVVIFWIALWIAGEWVRRRTENPLATAIFSAVVQAWIFAAMFVQL